MIVIVIVGELLLVDVIDGLHEPLNADDPLSLPDREEDGVDSELDVTLELAPNDSVDVGVADDDGDSEGVGEVVGSDVIDVD